MASIKTTQENITLETGIEPIEFTINVRNKTVTIYSEITNNLNSDRKGDHVHLTGQNYNRALEIIGVDKPTTLTNLIALMAEVKQIDLSKAELPTDEELADSVFYKESEVS